MNVRTANNVRYVCAALTVVLCIVTVVFFIFARVFIGALGVSLLALWYRAVWNQIGKQRWLAVAGYAVPIVVWLGLMSILNTGSSTIEIAYTLIGIEIACGLACAVLAGIVPSRTFLPVAPPVAYGYPPGYAQPYGAYPPPQPQWQQPPPAPPGQRHVMVRAPDGREHPALAVAAAGGYVQVVYQNGSMVWVPEGTVR
jgi:hypothetical protein